MRAMILDEIAPVDTSPLQWREVPSPEPGEGEVRMHVECCGVCRTDLHVIEGELRREKLPVIPGHQIIGRVDKLGPSCRALQVGDRVGVAWLRHTCGECPFCQRGQENLCEQSRYTGYHADGGYAELAVVPEAFAYRIPEAFDSVRAAPLLCAGIIGYRALERANVPEGGRLALYGFGSSAHIVFQLARHRGYTVYVVSRGADHLELARQMVAAWAGHDPKDMPERADSALRFAPVGHLVPPALEMLEKGGTLALAGIYMSDVPSMKYEKHLFYERDVRSVTANTREDGWGLLQEAAAIPLNPTVTAYPLQDANQALQELKSDRISGSAVLMVSSP